MSAQDFLFYVLSIAVLAFLITWVVLVAYLIVLVKKLLALPLNFKNEGKLFFLNLVQKGLNKIPFK